MDESGAQFIISMDISKQRKISDINSVRINGKKLIMKKTLQKANQESSFVLIQFQNFMTILLQQFIHSMKDHIENILSATVFINTKPDKVHALKSIESWKQFY